MILRSKTSKWFFVGFGWEMERKLHSFGHEARAKDIFLYEISCQLTTFVNSNMVGFKKHFQKQGTDFFTFENNETFPKLLKTQGSVKDFRNAIRLRVIHLSSEITAFSTI